MKTTENEKVVKTEKKRSPKVSMSYTLKSFKDNIQKLVEGGLITKAQAHDIDVIREEAVKEHVKREFGI